MADAVASFNIPLRFFGVAGRGSTTAEVGFRIEGEALDRALRDAQRRFVGPMQQAFATIHEEFAYKTVEFMRDHLDAGIRLGIATRGRFLDSDRPREDRSSQTSVRHVAGNRFGRKTENERMFGVLVDKRNYVHNARGFAAGIEDWLDASPAKDYWRAINYSRKETLLLMVRGTDPRTPRRPNKSARLSRAFGGYHFLEAGARKGKEHAERRIGREYARAGAGVGMKLVVREGSF